MRYSLFKHKRKTSFNPLQSIGHYGWLYDRNILRDREIYRKRKCPNRRQCLGKKYVEIENRIRNVIFSSMSSTTQVTQTNLQVGLQTQTPETSHTNMRATHEVQSQVQVTVLESGNTKFWLLPISISQSTLNG